MPQTPGADASLQFRAVTIGETEQFLDVFSAAFRLNRDAARPLFYRDPFFDLRFKRVCLDAGAIVSCLTVVPCRLRVGTGVVSMAGIAGVATRPESRRRGYAGALLTDTIRKSFSELSFPISGLFPAEPLYYARFGWTHASRSTLWTIRHDALTTEASDGVVRPITPSHPADIGAIAALHDAVTRERTGACYRGTMRWRVIHEMMAGRDTYVVDTDDHVDGYMHIETDVNRKSIVIHEMHASTKSAAAALLRFIADQPDIETVEWFADPADVEYFDLLGTATSTVDPDAMLRITDVRAALAALYNEVYAPVMTGLRKGLTLIIRDPINQANEVPVTIDAAGVRSGADGSLAVATDISTLTRLFVGYQSPTEARDAGSFYASDDRSLALAEKLFPKRDPQIPVLDRL